MTSLGGVFGLGVAVVSCVFGGDAGVRLWTKGFAFWRGEGVAFPFLLNCVQSCIIVGVGVEA